MLFPPNLAGVLNIASQYYENTQNDNLKPQVTQSVGDVNWTVRYLGNIVH